MLAHLLIAVLVVAPPASAAALDSPPTAAAGPFEPGSPAGTFLTVSGPASSCGPLQPPSGSMQGPCAPDAPASGVAFTPDRSRLHPEATGSACRAAAAPAEWTDATAAARVERTAADPGQDEGSGQDDQPQTRPHEHSGHGTHSDDTDDATVHHRFDGVERWVRLFDNPARAEWQKPEQVAKALRLDKGMAVADIGAGTGYFNRFLAAAVGPEGKVYAVDTEPEMIEHMKERAVEEGTPNVIPTLAKPANPNLPLRSVDRILIVNTYHHFDDRLDYFNRLKRALRPGGRVAIVDFKKGPIPVGPSDDLKLAREHVAGEMEAAGYRLAEEPEFLPYQYFLVFEPE